MMKKITVIGGGITGLSAAYRLQKAAQSRGITLDIKLLEASSRAGGVINTTRREGFVLEEGPDSFFTEKPQALNLCHELGLNGDLLETSSECRQSFIVRKGRLHPIPEGFFLLAPARLSSFFASPIISWQGKLRVLAEPFVPFRSREDESLGSFVRRRLGPEALDRLAQPLVAGIYGADAERLSLAATFPRFLKMERERRSLLKGVRRMSRTRQASGARYSLFMTLRSGMQELTDSITRVLGSIIRLNAPVRRIFKKSGTEWKIELQSGEIIETDGIIFALPAYTIAGILSRLAPSLSRKLGGIRYAHAATANFIYDEQVIGHPLNGFGFVVPAVEKRILLGCTFSHRKFPERAPAGKALIRAFIAGDESETIWRNPDEQTARLIEKDLEELLGIRAKPLFMQARRHRLAMPQYEVGHRQLIDSISHEVSHLPGLALAGSWLNGIGVPDCIASGEAAAISLLSNVSKS
jgi:oxygen-dependent protoporphyrinogen oxidase